MPAKPVTLAEIARRAGVHVSTVSRALGPGNRQVGVATVERITAIAEEMGYSPDLAAASLRTKKSAVIGVLVPRVTDYVLSRIYEGVADTARHAGYTTVIVQTEDDPVQRLQGLERLLARRVDGIVVGDARLDGDDVVSRLQRRGTPYVLVNRRLRGHLSVTTDDVLGGQLAAEHLLDAGHTQVGVIAGPTHASTCVERTYGLARTFLHHGIEIDPDLQLTSGSDAEAGYESALLLLRRRPDITAIFAINDFAAIGAMGAARELGRSPGEDVAVVGYNDIPLARFLPIPLSSVRSPMLEMGQGGARALLRSMSGDEPESETLPPTLVVRESSQFML